MKDTEISSKQIELLVGKNITLAVHVSGNCQGHFFGKLVGRIRNRFKQYVFVPVAPFTSFYFSTGDVESITMPEPDVWILTIKPNSDSEQKKKRRKKKKELPVVEMEPDMVIDLNNIQVPTETFMASDI